MWSKRSHLLPGALTQAHAAHGYTLFATFPGHGPFPPVPLVVNSSSLPKSETLSRESCKTTCAAAGFPFYGLEWSILCYCGGKQTTKAMFIDGIAAYKLADATEACSMPCPVGDTGDTCGGSGAIEIWEV